MGWRARWSRSRRSGSAAAPTTPGDGAAESGEPVTLTIWNSGYFSDGGKEVWDQIDSRFEKANPDIKIQHEGIPYENLYVKLRGTIAARRGPDLVTLFPGAFAGDYRDGFTPLDDFITDEQRDENPLWKTSQSPDGKTYAVPVSVYGYFLTFNKELFEKAGLDPEAPPTTDQELFEACGALREAGIEPLAAGWRDGYLLEWYLFVYGGQLLSPEDTERWMGLDLPASNPAFKGALDFVSDARGARLLQGERGHRVAGGGARPVRQGPGRDGAGDHGQPRAVPRAARRREGRRRRCRRSSRARRGRR